MQQSPLELYQQKLDRREIIKDVSQYEIIKILNDIYFQLIKRQKTLDKKINRLRQKIKPLNSVQGLYLYGNVGCGKTFLLDIFYECLTVKKIRYHFHAFMQKIHQLLYEAQGVKDPLQKIAKKISEDALVIFFDEFFVANIADAMILGELFKALFKNGVSLVTTSNIAPDELYKNGLQREQFLPAIDIIKNHVQIIHLETITDYRRRHLEKAGVYFTPLNAQAEKNMQYAFHYFEPRLNTTTEDIKILGRHISIIQQAKNIIWFDFYKICGRPRSQMDYLELVKYYDIFFISNVPIFNKMSDDFILSFIHLIDILYDTKKRLVISAEAPIHELYSEKKYKIEFDRTESRLIEMQSKIVR